MDNSTKDYIRKIIKEVLDYNEKFVIKKSKTNFHNVFNDFEPITATKEINIEGETIKISFFIDKDDKSLEISFTDSDNSFTLTNKNNISKILSTVLYQTRDFLTKLNKQFTNKKSKLKIRKIIIHPTKIKDKDDKMTAIQTSRGKVFDVFIKKILKINSFYSDSIKITYDLSIPIKIGYPDFNNI